MPQQPQGANLFIFVSQFVLIIGIFYFILIRPQKQEQRRVQDMLSKMAKNDEVEPDFRSSVQQVKAKEMQEEDENDNG